MSDTVDNRRMPSTADRQAIAEVYRLLARLWLREVDAPTLKLLQNNGVSEMLPAVIDLQDAADLEELAADYCQLLIGPREHLPPFQSVWEHGELQSDVTESIKSFAEVIRYQPDAFPNAMLDHIGIQLDIMGRIYSMAGVDVDASDGFGLGSHFFPRHLTWPRAFLHAVSEKAMTGFYRDLAKLTAQFLQSESDIWARKHAG